MISPRVWNNIVDRILNTPGMDQYLFLGIAADHGFPVIVPRKRESPHTWGIGPPGTGKTARYAAPLLTQQIAHCDRSIVVVDFKPDITNVWNTWIECARAGLPFRLFDPTPGRCSHIFNPCVQSHRIRQNHTQRIETLMQALTLEYGPDYAKAYFSAVNQASASDSFAKYPMSSIERLAELMLDPAAFAFIDKNQWKDAAHFRVTIAQGAAVPPLNAIPGVDGVTPAMLAAAIDMRQVFHQPQVIYFALNAAEMRTTSRLIMGLGSYNLFAAAAREKRKCDVELWIDEGQEFAGPGLSAILDRARSSGIAVTLMHQHLEQLRRADQDHAEALEAACGLHVVFAPTGQRIRKWIRDTGGTLTRPSVTWKQALTGRESVDDDFHLAYAAAHPTEMTPFVSVAETEVRAISENDLIRWSATPNIALVRLLRDEQGICYRGAWIPTIMGFHIDKKEYEEREDSDFPDLGPGAMFVPYESAYDRRFQEPKPSIQNEQLQATIRNLRSRKRK